MACAPCVFVLYGLFSWGVLVSVMKAVCADTEVQNLLSDSRSG